MTDADIELILVDPNEALCREWRIAFENSPRVSVVCGRFEALPEFDCMVSAANSFGLMDGGVDLAITRFFGEQLMQRVQTRILQEYLGEQPIGTSLIVETGHPAHPFVAHTPTMRVPMTISTTDNVYTAMWAMVLAVHRHNTSSSNQFESWPARASGQPPVVLHPTRLPGRWPSPISGIGIH